MLYCPLSMSPRLRNPQTSNIKCQGTALILVQSTLNSHRKLSFPIQYPLYFLLRYGSYLLNIEEGITSLFTTSIPFSVSVRQVFQGTTHFTLRGLSFQSLTPLCLISSISQIRKQSNSKGFAQGHTAYKWQNWDLSSHLIHNTAQFHPANMVFLVETPIQVKVKRRGSLNRYMCFSLNSWTWGKVGKLCGERQAESTYLSSIQYPSHPVVF